MSDIVYCKDCVYSAQSNLAGDFAELSNLVYCTYYKHNISIIRGCSNGKPKLKTNADLFRAKSDEELAKTISGDEIYPWCTEEPCKYNSCTDCVLAWLKQEAET